MLYFGNLKPASSSFFLLTFNESQCFCHKNRICFCRSAVTFQLPLQVCGVCPYAVPPSLASDPGDLLHKPIFSLTSCPTPPAPTVRSFQCPSLHELLFSLLLLINTHQDFFLGKNSLSLSALPQWLHPFSHLQPFFIQETLRLLAVTALLSSRPSLMTTH